VVPGEQNSGQSLAFFSCPAALALLAAGQKGFSSYSAVEPARRRLMYIIPRSENEGIVIDHDILVTVVEIGEDEVSIAIEYPEDTSVHTGEKCAALC
jgi:carbon storage regulator CsrA